MNDEQREIVSFLNSLRGNGMPDMERAVSFLLQMQKSRSLSPPPLAETIAVLKQEKPVLYGALKKRLATNLGLSILFQLELDYDTVRRTLGMSTDEDPTAESQ
ncbi:hypothetical protein MO973_44145 [Paenibacillus sp. TRM 82003]|nr:hypothetical protein [Paenibacillus sp. TRM 82003]